VEREVRILWWSREGRRLSAVFHCGWLAPEFWEGCCQTDVVFAITNDSKVLFDDDNTEMKMRSITRYSRIN